MSECLFCRIVRREIPARIAAETEHCLAFHDIAPQAPVHVVLIPKDHLDSMADASDALVVGRLAMLAASIARELGVVESGYRMVINSGADGGQTVHHLHAHLLAGRPLTWPPG